MTAALQRFLIVAILALPGAAQDAPRVPPGPSIGGVSQAEALRLGALGYVDYSAERSNLDRSGVTLFDESLAAKGHTLVVSSTECAARLIDLSGRELHRWDQQDCLRWWSARLMQNGDLVVDGGRSRVAATRTRANGKPSISRFAGRIAWTGELVWLRDIKAHHQLDWTPSKEILLLTESVRPLEEVSRRAPSLTRGADENLVFHDNALVWLDPEGGVRETLSLFDAVTTGPVRFVFRPRDKILETPSHVGLFHANSAYAMDQPHLEGSSRMFSKQNVLVTSRNQNRIFVVNRRSRSLVWEWGRNELQAPHCATWLANGHILVFDNGIERKTSRILEVDPASGQIVWEYPKGAAVEFHSEVRGLAQRLANGNTLITNSQAGEAFEVTPAGITVWQYFAPALKEKSRRPVLMSLHRYPEWWLEPLRDRPQREDH